MKTITKTIDNFTVTFNFLNKDVHVEIKRHNVIFENFNCSRSSYATEGFDTINEIVDHEVNILSENLDINKAISDIKTKYPNVDIEKIVDVNAINLFDFIANNTNSEESARYRFAKYAFQRLNDWFMNAAEFIVKHNRLKYKINDIFSNYKVWEWDFFIKEQNANSIDAWNCTVNGGWREDEAPYLTEFKVNELRNFSSNNVHAFARAHTYGYAINKLEDVYQHLVNELNNDRYGAHLNTVNSVYGMFQYNGMSKGIHHFIKRIIETNECEERLTDIKNIFSNNTDNFNSHIEHGEWGFDNGKVYTFRKDLLAYLNSQLVAIKKVASIRVD